MKQVGAKLCRTSSLVGNEASVVQLMVLVIQKPLSCDAPWVVCRLKFVVTSGDVVVISGDVRHH